MLFAPAVMYTPYPLLEVKLELFTTILVELINEIPSTLYIVILL